MLGIAVVVVERSYHKMSFRQKDFRKIRRMESSNAILQILLLALVFTGVNYLALHATTNESI